MKVFFSSIPKEIGNKMNFFRESLAKKSDTFSTSAKSFPLTPNCYQQKQNFFSWLSRSCVT